jgi:hypothetical protein
MCKGGGCAVADLPIIIVHHLPQSMDRARISKEIDGRLLIDGLSQAQKRPSRLFSDLYQEGEFAV